MALYTGQIQLMSQRNWCLKTPVLQKHMFSHQTEKSSSIHEVLDFVRILDLNKKLVPLTTYNVVSEQWDFIGSNGCEIGDGMHLLVVSQPDHDIVATQSFEYENSGDESCLWA